MHLSNDFNLTKRLPKHVKLRKYCLWLSIGLVLLLLIAYTATCFRLYHKQKRLLFPSHITQPVPKNWEPHAGDYATQAIIQGHCGDLHIAKWDIKGAKGTLMMFHGNGESLASINDYAWAFHQLGYNLMAWDYPGYGRSQDCDFNEHDLLADAEIAYAWLAKQESPKRIYLFGYSLGTGLALSVARQHPENPVFLVAAYDSMLNVAKDAMPAWLPVEWLMRYPLPAWSYAKATQQPIYLIHGTRDHLIKPERAKALLAAAPTRMHIEWVEDVGHTDDALFAYRNQWLKRLLP